MISSFIHCQRGAVTIDWVALAAGIMLLGMTLVYAIFNTGVGGLSSSINTNLSAAGVNVDTGDAPDAATFQ